MKQKNTMQSDPRQLDLFAVAEEIFGTHFILEASPTAALQAPEETREKIYNMHGPILELTAAEEDRFHKGGFRKLAASMLMGAIDDVLHAITPESKTAALAYFTEADGPFPFETVLDWLGPPWTTSLPRNGRPGFLRTLLLQALEFIATGEPSNSRRRISPLGLWKAERTRPRTSPKRKSTCHESGGGACREWTTDLFVVDVC
ncbi:hypothetical protein WJ976_32810 (plasmid) [Achromobacter denitrificans]